MEKIANSLLDNELCKCNFLPRVRKHLKTEVFRCSLKLSALVFIVLFLIAPSKTYSQNSGREGNFEWRLRDDGVEITRYNGSVFEVTIPNRINGKPVIAIGEKAFAFQGLTSVTIPDSVTRIGNAAFRGNSLASVNIPRGVIEISVRAFADNKLTGISIPGGVTQIEYGVFENNKLTSVNIPNSVTIILENAFYGNLLTSVTIPNSVRQIRYGAFRQNQLTNVVLPNSIKNLDNEAFDRNVRITR
ncbi:MAG: leucine-rich repeat domain-containing protein [Treponema sp.]|nr:leucine-rich repeat domain-containing protein [Treponema sp.]